MDPTARLLQDLYNSEINYTIATFWDAGFRVLLGDDLNGFVAETRVPTFTDAAQWLAIAAVTHYPDSEFAKKYSTLGLRPTAGAPLT
ncbi:hypothetical protein ACFQZO_10225 [Bradyrhizobium sp. GCM10027634]|uniref:hypothetical protein n=1 Tax=unclassified Bradyrhizobium TaxID=2631580 RepID=UPI00263ACAB5|nr:hypothetical protein [Bradyrhizobium sp. WYCCWR 12677]MDN5001260.1 hypothetical protein [Bradyrhizobium sp. WYCCWR 12677]